MCLSAGNDGDNLTAVDDIDPELVVESTVRGRSPLTERETDVLRAAADGGSVEELASALFLSTGTVRNRLSAAIGKTDARNRADAARIARDNGWL
ncbi:MAG TPA: DNA-binding response regulator [Brevibacterium sp.]|uniref:Regulatory protein, luxR family n=1 Tax=Brevibacterium antiquum CNRZ 918 TaxID=1255637 RepID=A0A2H1I549_9MICO|nr:regulatory protein, luxR family [Brevibacterium antiquum CNRZ 918]HCG55161.1 DNA-binding response regulator [Brevibacterium sp.]